MSSAVLPRSSLLSVVALWTFLVAVAQVHAAPQNVRFPEDGVVDDGRAGRVLLPPLRNDGGPPRRGAQLRLLANPLALTIPRELLPLGEPDQYLNSWQFYFPPGPPPPPPGSEQGQLDAAGSAAVPTSLDPAALTEIPRRLEKVTELSTTEVVTSPTPTVMIATTSVAPPTSSTTSSPVAPEESQPLPSISPPSASPPSDFKPKFEEGGWTPIQGLPVNIF